MLPRRSSFPHSDVVFLNVPFDEEYEPLYLALIGGLVRLGLRPRCVLEISTQKDRLRRIFNLIRRCGSSVHDLSRVEPSDEYPRFNMPFEAGLAVAWAQVAGRSHRWFLLERQSHRLQRTLSDLNGFEVFIHGGTEQGLLATLPNIFVRKEAPALPDLLACTRQLRASAERLKNDMGSKDLFQPAAFRKLALVAAEIAELSRKGRLPTGP